MTLLVPNVGEELALKNFLNHTAPQNPDLKLFKSNTTPAEGDTAGTYTEADFDGYAEAPLTGSSFTVTGGAPSEASYAQQTFTRASTGAAQDVYGYYLTQATSGILMWAERFSDGPYTVTNDGDDIKVTVKITAD